MKLMLVCLLSLLAAYPTNAVAVNVNPVSRVVQLLEDLSKQVETEGKKEEDLYESFVCWGKSVIQQKTDGNTAAASRIDTLAAYVADLDGNRVELTSERTDLEKEIAAIRGDMEESKAMREKENADFKVAEDEMVKAVRAMDSAIKVLHAATHKHKSTLLAVKQDLSGGMEALAEQQVSLRSAVELGHRFLTKPDALFLQRLLLGDVPKVDWRKLNRKAGFKMAYKARSTKIQDVLDKMHSTFADNLKDARANDAKADATYKKLRSAKQGKLVGFGGGGGGGGGAPAAAAGAASATAAKEEKKAVEEEEEEEDQDFDLFG